MRTVIRLSQFIPSYEKAFKKQLESRLARRRPRPIRVAIIDSGVDLGKFETDNLVGASFSELGRSADSYWWLSSEEHGTQMAKIIKSIDPCCQLFIAAVADHRTEITAGAVTQVCRPQAACWLGYSEPHSYRHVLLTIPITLSLRFALPSFLPSHRSCYPVTRTNELRARR